MQKKEALPIELPSPWGQFLQGLNTGQDAKKKSVNSRTLSLQKWRSETVRVGVDIYSHFLPVSVLSPQPDSVYNE